jgi:hypothetical protein
VYSADEAGGRESDDAHFEVRDDELRF